MLVWFENCASPCEESVTDGNADSEASERKSPVVKEVTKAALVCSGAMVMSDENAVVICDADSETIEKALSLGLDSFETREEE